MSVPDTDRDGIAPEALHDVLVAARDLGFLGPGPIERHLRHAEGFAALARAATTVEGPRLLDLGSGGGLPGLVVAGAWPGATMVLLDANERRVQFLDRAVVACALQQRVRVVHQRAEVFGQDPEFRATFDGVVVRSFGAPAVVAECAAPLLRLGGWLIVSEPPAEGETESEELERWPATPLRQLGLQPTESIRTEFGYQVLRQVELCPERFPRRNGVPTKKPLF